MKKVTIQGREYSVYADLEDADYYFHGVFGSNWCELPEEDRAKLLVTATRTIDKGQWKGCKVDEEQVLEFPRMIYGKETNATLVMNACCEEAYGVYLSGTSEYANTDGIKSMKVQDTEITFKDNAEESLFKSNNAEDLLKNYAYSGVSVIY